MVTARVARSQLNFSFMKSKSGPDVTNRAFPLIKKPAPIPCRPSTLLLPKVTKTFGLWANVGLRLVHVSGGDKQPAVC